MPETTETDSPWKNILDDYFPAFMELLFPVAHADIDWDRKYKLLDKELQKIVRDADVGRRLADKLIQVHRKSGEELVVLVHIEVQAQQDSAFARRMYAYHHRISDRYDTPVVSLAVLGDENQTWRPELFSYALWGCRLVFEFPMVKLVDYRRRWSEMESSDNPFTTVVMIHIKALETKRNASDRKHWKMQLTRRMYERGFEKQIILDIFHFIDWMMTLPKELEKQFEKELETYEKERQMPYVTAIERNGIEKGKLEGRQEGRQEGHQEGLQLGECKTLLRILGHRFGTVPRRFENAARNADVEQLEQWIDRALDAETIDAVFSA